MRLKCRLMDPQNNGVDWTDLTVSVEADEDTDAARVAELVNQATYEEVVGEGEKATGKLARCAGSASHGIAWFDDEHAGDCIIEWHVRR